MIEPQCSRDAERGMHDQATTCLALLTLSTIVGFTGAQGPSFLGRPIEAWLRELDEAAPSKRRNAAFALGQIGKAAAHTAPQLIRALKDSDASVRNAAAFALGDIGRVHPLLPDDVQDATQPLMELLQRDSDERVRRSAAYALGSLGIAMAEPLLRQSLRKDSAATVRQNAAWALGKLRRRPSAETIDDLKQAKRDLDPCVRRDAAAALDALRKAN